MQEEELIKQLRAENEQLKREIELLKDYSKELEARLAKYENAHTPSSLRRGRNHRKDQNGGDTGKPGRKLGHEGVTDRRLSQTSKLKSRLINALIVGLS
jgi:transposase